MRFFHYLIREVGKILYAIAWKEEKHNLCCFWEISILMFTVKIGEMKMQIFDFTVRILKKILKKNFSA